MYALWQNHMQYFNLFLLEMLGFIHCFMTGYLNPKLSRVFEAIAIQIVPMGFYMYFHLPVSIHCTCNLEAVSSPFKFAQ